MKRKKLYQIVGILLFTLVSGLLFCCGTDENGTVSIVLEGTMPETGETGTPSEDVDFSTEGAGPSAVEAEFSAKEAGQGMESGLSEETGQGSAGQSAGGPGQEAGLFGKGAGQEDVLTVYIYGCVKHPGVYELPVGSRLYQLVEQAGGFTGKAWPQARNQAEPLTDGAAYGILSKKAAKKEERLRRKQEDGQLFGNAASENDGGMQPDASGAVGEPQKVNLNTAGKEALMTLPGIGEAKADAILAYRQEQGGFQRIEDIMKISGIKEGVFCQIQEKITV